MEYSRIRGRNTEGLASVNILLKRTMELKGKFRPQKETYLKAEGLVGH